MGLATRKRDPLPYRRSRGQVGRGGLITGRGPGGWRALGRDTGLLPWTTPPPHPHSTAALLPRVLCSRFSAEFDDDPRRWRMVAELLSTAGMGLEVCTLLVPQHFLALACGGKFMQVGASEGRTAAWRFRTKGFVL